MKKNKVKICLLILVSIVILIVSVFYVSDRARRKAKVRTYRLNEFLEKKIMEEIFIGYKYSIAVTTVEGNQQISFIVYGEIDLKEEFERIVRELTEETLVLLEENDCNLHQIFIANFHDDSYHSIISWNSKDGVRGSLFAREEQDILVRQSIVCNVDEISQYIKD